MIQVLISWVPQELQTIKFGMGGAAPSEKSMRSLMPSSLSDRSRSKMRKTAKRKNDSIGEW
jgi:hypothetical protein